MTGSSMMAAGSIDDELIAPVKAIIAAWDARDWDAATALFVEDGMIQSMMQPPIVGRTAIRAILETLRHPHKVTLNVQHIGVIDGLVFVERVDEFSSPGYEAAVPAVGIFEVENGLIKEWREYYDRQQLIEAMGPDRDYEG